MVDPVLVGTPVNNAVGAPLNQKVSWSATTGAESYNVYFGTSANPPLVVSGNAATSYDPGKLSYDKTYYWRVDAKGGGDVASGNSFEFASTNFVYDPTGFIVAHDCSDTNYSDASAIHKTVQNHHLSALPARIQSGGGFRLTSVKTKWYGRGTTIQSVDFKTNGDPSAINFGSYDFPKSANQEGPDDIIVDRYQFISGDPGDQGFRFFFSTQEDYDRFKAFSGQTNFYLRKGSLPYPSNTPPWQTSTFIGMRLEAENPNELSLTYIPRYSSNPQENLNRVEALVNDLNQNVINLGQAPATCTFGLAPYNFVTFDWRHGPSVLEPEYNQPNRGGIAQFRIAIGECDCPTDPQGYANWDSRDGDFPQCLTDAGVDMIPNNLFSGTGYDLVIRDRAMSPTSQWPMNNGNDGCEEDPITGVPIEDGLRRYPKTGPLVFNNISMIGIDQNGYTMRTSDSFCRLYNLDDLAVYDSDFERNHYQHGLYNAVAGNFYCQGTTFSELAGKPIGVIYRAGTENYGPFPSPNNNNTRFLAEHEWKVKDTHFHNAPVADILRRYPSEGMAPGTAGFQNGWNGFCLEYSNPGNSQFPGNCIVEDCSFVNRQGEPDPYGSVGNGYKMAGKLFLVKPAINVQSDPKWDIYSMPTESVNTEADLADLDPVPQQSVKVLDTGDVWFWPEGTGYEQPGGSAWIKFENHADGYPIRVCRVSNTLWHHAPVIEVCHLINFVKEVIYEHNCIKYDGGGIEYPELTFRDNFEIHIDAIRDEDSLGNVLSCSSIRLSNNIGVGVGGGGIEFQFRSRGRPGSSPSDYGTVFTYQLTETNNLGRTVIVNKAKFPVLEVPGPANDIRVLIDAAMNSGTLRIEGQNDQGGVAYQSGAYGPDQTWFNDFFIDRPYDVALDGPLPTSSTGSGPRRTPPSIDAPPGRVTGLSPADGETDVFTDITTFSWSLNGSVSSYNVYLGTEENNLLLQTPTPITTNYYDPGTLQENQQYFWRVDATNTFGTTEGNVLTFTTGGPSPPAPGPPNNIYPTVGKTDVSREPLLTWSAPVPTDSLGPASGYDVYFDTSDNWDPNSPNKIIEDTVVLSVNPNSSTGGILEYSTEYTWRVEAKNITGSSASEDWTFTTEDPPAPPGAVTVVIPTANETDVSINQSLSWQAPTNGGPITEYKVYFNTDALWTGGADNVAILPASTTSWSPPNPLEYGTLYRWAIIAFGPGGNTNPGNRTFTTENEPDPPGAAVNRNPESNATDVSLNQNLSWQAPASGGPIDFWKVYFDPDAEWGGGDSFKATLPANETSWSPPQMDPDTLYRWAVIAFGPGGNTNPGSLTFTTEVPVAAPGAPTGLSPSGGVIGVYVNQSLSWEAPTSGGPVEEYDVYLGVAGGVLGKVSTQSNSNLTFTPQTLLSLSTSYRWKVVARGPGGETETPIAAFTTITEVDPTPVNPPNAVTVGRPNGATNVLLNSPLLWNAVLGAAEYEVFFGTSSPPTTSIGTTTSDTIIDPGPLSDSTTYYWRVDASNVQGVTTGDEFSFSTITILSPPGQVTEGQPNNATNVPIEATLSWSQAFGAEEYLVYLEEGNPTNPEVLIGTTTESYLDVTLLNDVSYSWRVDAVNSDGVTTGTVFSFTTVALNPPGSVIEGIPNDVINYTIDPTLAWRVPVSGGPIDKYDVYLGASGEIPTLLGSSNSTFLSVLGLNYNTYYQWRVDSVNGDGVTSGTVFNFTTEFPPSNDPPTQVTNLSPENSSSDVPLNTLCVWSPVSDATGYNVYFGTTANPPLVSSNQELTFFSPAEVIGFDTTYFWRVDSVNTAGVTEGITWQFTTVVDEPVVPSPERITTSGFDLSSYASRSRSYDTRETDIRKKIFTMTQSKQNISFVYRDSLRAMISSFNDLGYISAEDEYKEIKCLHANSERAIAKLKEEDNIVLPIVTISQTTTSNDDARRRQESILVNEKVWDREKNRAVRVLSLAPRPVNISYQVNVWCKYMADMDQVLEQIRLKFNPEMNVSTQSSTIAKAYLDTEEDIGSITAGDKEDRIIKKTFNVVFRTYVPNPKFMVTSTGKIEEFKTEVDIG